MILFGERSLRRALSEYVDHFHAERNHQGKGNVLLFPLATDRQREGPVQCRERLGGSYATIIVRRRDGPTARPIIWPHGIETKEEKTRVPPTGGMMCLAGTMVEVSPSVPLCLPSVLRQGRRADRSTPAS